MLTCRVAFYDERRPVPYALLRSLETEGEMAALVSYGLTQELLGHNRECWFRFGYALVGLVPMSFLAKAAWSQRRFRLIAGLSYLTWCTFIGESFHPRETGQSETQDKFRLSDPMRPRH